MDTIVILQTVDGNMRKVTETKSIKSKQVQFSDTQVTKAKKGWKKRGSVGRTETEHNRRMIRRFRTADVRRQLPDSCNARKRRAIMLLVILTLLEVLAMFYKTAPLIHQASAQTFRNPDTSVEVKDTLKEEAILRNISEIR